MRKIADNFDEATGIYFVPPTRVVTTRAGLWRTAHIQFELVSSVVIHSVALVFCESFDVELKSWK